jgi:pimeloyl-ACP methyl ester carboxylesterase
VLVSAARAVSAAAFEVGWVTARAAMYPLGLLRDRGDDVDPGLYTLTGLPPARRGLLGVDVAAATTPIVLVHGIVDNRSAFTMLRRGLRRRGFGCIRAFSYPPHTSDVRATASRLGVFIDGVCDETGADYVHVVGHSLGGLVARYYVQRLGGDAKVHTLVTLGTPHEGTHAARFLPHPLIRQLRPDSDLVNELAEPAPQCATRFVAVHSDIDQMIVPARSAMITHPDLDARNLPARGIGHLALPVSGRVVHQICTSLVLTDHDGASPSHRAATDPALAAPAMTAMTAIQEAT